LPLQSDDLYRALRFVNPSPYLFFLKLDDLTLIGSSPEVMVRKEEGNYGIASHCRDKTKRQEPSRKTARYPMNCLSDEKERAEHVMLVDLGPMIWGVCSNRAAFR